jgi:Predicted restriction endonuclease
MAYSNVEKLNESQELMHIEFTNYLIGVVGRKGKTPAHLTESLERRVQIFAREHVNPSFTCVYDYSDTNFLQTILESLKNNHEWYDYSKRHGSTLTSSLEHYINFLNYRKDHVIPQPTCSPDSYKEGRISYVHAVGYERNQDARKACIAHYGCKCAICGFDFEKVYGEIGRDFIEVHHIVPIHERKGEYTVDPITDLRPLCSNCHSMVHRRKPVYSIDELKDMLHNH